MKHILVLVDLTKTATRAVSQALALAVERDAYITICHIRTHASSDSEEEIRNQLAPLLAEAEDAGVRCEVCICQGDLFEEAAASVKRLKPDLTVAGTHGSAGIDLSNFGSAIHRLVRSVSEPTLVIGQSCRVVDEGFRKVLIPAGSQSNYMRGVHKACDVMTDDGEIILYAIKPKGGALSEEILRNIDEAKKLLDTRAISWHYEEAEAAPHSVGFAAQTLEYMRKADVEMVVIPAEISKENRHFGKLDKEAMLLNEDGIQVLCVNGE